MELASDTITFRRHHQHARILEIKLDLDLIDVLLSDPFNEEMRKVLTI